MTIRPVRKAVQERVYTLVKPIAHCMNMTSVNLADLGVHTNVWTSAITPFHPILAKQLLNNSKIQKRVGILFP